MNLFDIGADFKSLAEEKIDKELKDFNGDKYGKAVYTYVADALKSFCRQDVVFAETLFKTKRSLSDCVAEIMKGCGNAISDIEVYRRAAKLYFPNSEVEFLMNIKLTGEEPDEKYLAKESKADKKEKKAQTAEKENKNKKENPQEKADVIQLSLF